MLPTPTTRPNNHRSGHDAHGMNDRGKTLAEAATLLPTPIAQSARQVGARNNSRSGRTLNEAVGVAASRLPTPTTNPQAPNRGSNQVNGPTSLLEAARLLPTPTSSDFKRSNHDAERTGTRGGKRLSAEAWATEGNNRGESLPEAVSQLAARGMLPTPTAQDSRASGTAGNRTEWADNKHTGVTLTDLAVRGLDLRSNESSRSVESTGTGGARLNPAFVEWMMGLPPGWATIPPMPINSTFSATGSSGRRRPSRSSSSGSVSTEGLQMALFGEISPPTKEPPSEPTSDRTIG
jgi:hypothetical protein